MYPRACYFLLLLVLSSKATANQITNVKQRNIERTVSVVNLEFCMSCLSAEEREYKETYKEVSTYAELKQDPIADLPPAFTICSSTMTTYGKTQMFFNILGEDGNSWLQPTFNTRNEKAIFLHKNVVDIKLPQIFAHQWVRSCAAINSELGLLQWVVGGILVENATVDVLRDTNANKPTDLTGKIVLGA